MAYCDKTAFTGAFCTETKVADLFFKLAGEVVTKSCSGEKIFIIFFRKAGICVGNLDAYVRRGCKRITLYMVDGKKIISEMIDTFQSFVSWITFSVYGMKLLTQLF